MANARPRVLLNIQPQDTAIPKIVSLGRLISDFARRTKDFFDSKGAKGTICSLFILLFDIRVYAAGIVKQYEEYPQVKTKVELELKQLVPFTDGLDRSITRFVCAKTVLHKGEAITTALIEEAEKLRDSPQNKATEDETIMILRRKVNHAIDELLLFHAMCNIHCATVELSSEIQVQISRLKSIENILGQYFLKNFSFVL